MCAVKELSLDNLIAHYANGSLTSQSEKYIHIGDTLDIITEESQCADMYIVTSHCS